jgi:type VI secretion system lysozyme-like protein
MAPTKMTARAPLFDRLTDLNPTSPEESRPLRVYDLHELKESVRRELECVLNTRCPSPVHRLEGRGRTILDYGLPDMSALCPQNADDRQRLTRFLKQTIETFEPRLRQVRIEVEPVGSQQHALRGKIDAHLVTERVAEPVSFPVFIQSKNGEARVYASE